MKSCYRCGTEKPETAFYRNKAKPDGLASQCKGCSDSMVKNWQHAHPRRLLDWNRRYYRNNPEKKRAHSVANYAVSRGQLDRHPCVRCGAGVAEKHHPDYRKPRLVVWLCRRCHRQEHAA